jgi:hypothetical protein
VLGNWNQGYLMVVLRYPETGVENRYYMNIVGNGP